MATSNGRQVVVLTATAQVEIDETTGTPILSANDKKNDEMDLFNHPRERRARILSQLKKQAVTPSGTSLEIIVPAPQSNLQLYRKVHTNGLIDFLESAWAQWDDLGEEGQDPVAFLHQPIDDATPPLKPVCTMLPRESVQRPSTHIMGQIGYYCTDTMTPVFADLLPELCQDGGAVTKAVELLTTTSNTENPTVYILTNHPGHHSAADCFGGYCYVNHVAATARLLQESSDKFARVAILDVDYHAGNGTEAIFYDDPSVLFISIHCDPNHDYPFHSGFADETGAGEGVGATLNLPLPPGTKWEEYKVALERAMKAIGDFGAQALIVSLGLDTLYKDPCAIRRAGFKLEGDDYVEMGKMIASGGLPTIIVQEGGYRMEKIAQAATDVVTSFCAA